MISKKELTEMIMDAKMEQIPEKEDVYEAHIYLDNGLVLIIGYDKEESYCEEDPQEECGITFYWYWELRNSETWELIQENKEKDFTFCKDSEKEMWSDEADYDADGDLSITQMCTWSDQETLEDIADTIAAQTIIWMGE